MRYLYGDSAPFPLQYNFLATLETFVASAARAAQLDAEARAIQDTTAEAAVARAKALVALEGFHHAVVRTIQENAARSTDTQVLDYARQVAEHAVRIVEDAKRNCVAVAEREQGSTRAEVDRRNGEIRHALEQFLIVGRIPVLESHVSLNVADGKNDLAATFTHPESIVTRFKLNSTAVQSWQSPRKVSDFAHGVDLMIGLKKSLFKRTTQPEAVHLDDYIITGFELSDDAAEIRLRRRLTDARETFVFNLARQDDQLVAVVHHPSEVESEAPTAIDFADRQQLERLWQLLRAGVSDALVHKERLITVRLDGQDLFEQGRALPFVERIIRMIAPTVAEIAKRSPNPHELSLKMENDGGRREEIYLRKEDLMSKLEPLGEKERSLFAPLTLTRDKWLSEASVQIA